MASDKDMISIGIIWQAGGHWHAGALYRENLVKVLLPFAKSGEIKLSLVIDNLEELPHEFDPSVNLVQARDYSLIPGVGRIEAESQRREVLRSSKSPLKWLKRRFTGFWTRRILKREPGIGLPPVVRDEDSLVGMCRDGIVNFLYPLPKHESDRIFGAHWIPDLQHCFLPELFSDAELEKRNEQFSALADSEAIVFSSEASRDDFTQFWPNAKADLSVWHFCSVLDESVLSAEPSEVVAQYGLSGEYFMVPNQFWKHKDHFCVLEALERLGENGIRPTVLFTGAIDDYRNKDHINRFLQSTQKMGLHEQVRLLGFMDRMEQIALLRGAAAVIQPSRFEGWSTVVEDCRAVGQRLILSDLPVHREQAPAHSVFFATGSAEKLAASVVEMLPTNPDWVSGRVQREGSAISAMETLRNETGANFIRMARSLQGGQMEGQGKSR